MYIFLAVVVLLFLAWVSWGYFSVRNVEMLDYETLDSSKEYEIRQYSDYIVAETELDENFDNAKNKAFSILAGYIFGGNESKEKIAMTTPVTEKPSEKIAMTTPVIVNEESKLKTFSFVIPKKYTLEQLPKPLNNKVKIREIKGEKVAVLRFRGFFNSTRVEKKKEELRDYLNRDGISFSTISSAGYNPPWTPPFMTRNEVWAVIK